MSTAAIDTTLAWHAHNYDIIAINTNADNNNRRTNRGRPDRQTDKETKARIDK